MARKAEERGETLVEILITITIIGTALVAVVAAMGASILSSDAHRSQAEVEVVLRDFGEVLKAAAAENTGASWQACPDWEDPTFFDPATAFSAQPGWTVTVTETKYWIPGTFPNGSWTTERGNPASPAPGSCLANYQTCGNAIPACDPGHQLVTYVVSNDETVEADYAQVDFEGRVLLRRSDT